MAIPFERTHWAFNHISFHLASGEAYDRKSFTVYMYFSAAILPPVSGSMHAAYFHAKTVNHAIAHILHRLVQGAMRLRALAGVQFRRIDKPAVAFSQFCRWRMARRCVIGHERIAVVVIIGGEGKMEKRLRA